MKKWKQNRQGFSLMELIILIAIMSVFIGLASLGIGMLRASDTKKLAYGIEDGLTALKSRDTAGKETVYMHLFVHNGKYYRTITNSTAAPAYSGKEKELGDTKLSIAVTYDVKDQNGAALPDRSVTLSESGTKDICIGVAKKDGAFLYQKISGTNHSEAPREIKVIGTGATNYLVYMVTDTGKHYVEVQ